MHNTSLSLLIDANLPLNRYCFEYEPVVLLIPFRLRKPPWLRYESGWFNPGLIHPACIKSIMALLGLAGGDGRRW